MLYYRDDEVELDVLHARVSNGNVTSWGSPEESIFDIFLAPHICPKILLLTRFS